MSPIQEWAFKTFFYFLIHVLNALITDFLPCLLGMAIIPAMDGRISTLLWFCSLKDTIVIILRIFWGKPNFWRRSLCWCVSEGSLLWISRKANLLFTDLCSHHSRIWHGVSHRGFCFPADINNDTYNFLLVQLSHKHLSIREMANYLLNLKLCLDWVKYWLPRLKGKLCHWTWTLASPFLGAFK